MGSGIQYKPCLKSLLGLESRVKMKFVMEILVVALACVLLANTTITSQLFFF